MRVPRAYAWIVSALITLVGLAVLFATPSRNPWGGFLPHGYCLTWNFRVRQVLGNLVNNAIKFTETGSVHIRVGQKQADHAGKAVVRFEVEDTGSVSRSPRRLKSFVRSCKANPRSRDVSAGQAWV